jgi:hypothetical protein
MAKDCGVARSTIKKALARLVGAGKICISYRKNTAGDQDSNLYSFPQVWVGRSTTHLGRNEGEGRSNRDVEVGRKATPNLESTNNQPISPEKLER